jgi:hypothetical protein
MVYSKWHDVFVRAGRTFAQGFVGVLSLLALPILNNLIQAVAGGGDAALDLNIWRSIGIAAVAGGVISLVSFAQNWFEESTGKTIGPK